MPQTGSIASSSAGAVSRPPATAAPRALARLPRWWLPRLPLVIAPEARSWTSSARIGDRYLRVRRAAQVEPGRHPDVVQLLGGHAPVGEVAEHGRAALLRPDQAKVGGPGGRRPLEHVLVVVSLGGDDHHRPLVRVLGAEVPAGDQVGVPAQRLGQFRERLRHRRAAHDHEAGSGQYRLDVHLKRSFALAGDGHDGHPFGDGAAELLRAAEQQQAGGAGLDHLAGLADDRGLGAGAADPAVQLAAPR